MKKATYLIIAFVIIYACNDSQNLNNHSKESGSVSQVNFKEKPTLGFGSDSILNQWLGYYKKAEPNFSLSNFNLTTEDSLHIISGNVFGVFDKEYDDIYNSFLIYSSDKTKYVDFDSYHWAVDEDGERSFSPDQEINLIDINDKTVKRIGFRGSYQWVEDAFWKNDSIIVLLENDDEKQPWISLLDIKNGIVRTFKYDGSLEFETNYAEQRFKQIGIKNTTGNNGHSQ